MYFIRSLTVLFCLALVTSNSLANTRESGATIQVKEFADVTVHAFVAPYEMFGMSTYIIESKNKLVLIDGQMFTPLANDYRAYANSLGKPIDRLILTHAHPDHYLGLVAFDDIPIYALADSITEIKESGEQTRVARKQMMGDIIPDRIVVPNNELIMGSLSVDGVTYDISSIRGGEHSPMAIVRLNESKVIAVGDTAMHGVHLFLASAFEPWTDALRGLASEQGFDTVLTGHGGFGSRDTLDENIRYLEKASELMNKGVDAQQFKTSLVEAFPNLKMTAAIDFFLPYLFPEK